MSLLSDNPALQSLKAVFTIQDPQVEGTIQVTSGRYGFLKTNDQMRYFIPPQEMQWVAPEDKIIGRLRTELGKSFVQIERLVESSFKRFVGQLKRVGNSWFIEPENCPHLRILVPPCSEQTQWRDEDWVVGNLLVHPLVTASETKTRIRTPRWTASVLAWISNAMDKFLFHKKALAKFSFCGTAPKEVVLSEIEALAFKKHRRDMRHIPFVTIDGASTQDMDDAVYAQACETGYRLWVAVADPAEYVLEGSDLDAEAQRRGFSLYLPGFSVPMLPKSLAEHYCSLKPDASRLAIVCEMHVDHSGNVDIKNAEFSEAYIQSAAKLTYEQVSDVVENKVSSSPLPTTEVLAALKTLHTVGQLLRDWREAHAIIFQNRPEYRFLLDDSGRVLQIFKETKRIAHYLVEEMMVAANRCGAQYLSQHGNLGVFSGHAGFEANAETALLDLIEKLKLNLSVEACFTLPGFIALKQAILASENPYYAMRVTKLLRSGQLSQSPQPHFGMGFDCYATWTSPIRKYGDLINHRLIKRSLSGADVHAPALTAEVLKHLDGRRKASRHAEREVNHGLYLTYLTHQVGQVYQGIIVDVYRTGIRVRLEEIGAYAFLSAKPWEQFSGGLILDVEQGQVLHQGSVLLQLGQTIPVRLLRVPADGRAPLVELAITFPDLQTVLERDYVASVLNAGLVTV